MSHLIAGTTEEFDLQMMLAELREVHEFLTEHGAKAIRHAAELGPSPKRGQSVKRIRVEIPNHGRPDLAEFAPSEHSITEVYNQCANVERLIDAIKRCLSPTYGFWDGLGLTCHPTISSGKAMSTDHDDHDLVSAGSECTTRIFRDIRRCK